MKKIIKGYVAVFDTTQPLMWPNIFSIHREKREAQDAVDEMGQGFIKIKLPNKGVVLVNIST